MEGGAKKASKGEWDMVINKMLEVVDCTTGRRVQDGRNVVVAFGTGEFESFRIVRVDVYFTSKNVQDLIPIDCSLPMAAHSPVIKDKLDASDPPKHHASTPNIEQVRSYLHHKCRVTISDGREFVGYFVCVDKQKNMILSATEEHIQGTTRHVGLVMIPGPHLRKWEVLHLADDDDDNDEPSSITTMPVLFLLLGFRVKELEQSSRRVASYCLLSSKSTALMSNVTADSLSCHYLFTIESGCYVRLPTLRLAMNFVARMLGTKYRMNELDQASIVLTPNQPHYFGMRTVCTPSPSSLDMELQHEP
ncbi:hypothetical protein SeMB42_g05195 [Synchytrium endobioticum]|uniref:Sm domain-containing protein n=1 Tax=Synchytrium endobioticum TaxID=286115 RepID=A0A507CSZ0_9FUNG|nr:hypothetical protein SeMB42_g05195 [Synchytrium endobioticum]